MEEERTLVRLRSINTNKAEAMANNATKVVPTTSHGKAVMRLVLVEGTAIMAVKAAPMIAAMIEATPPITAALTMAEDLERFVGFVMSYATFGSVELENRGSFPHLCAN